MVLIMYESENNGLLQPIDNDTLQQKLVAWFINKTPIRNHVVEKLRYTGIPLAYYDNIIRARFPESWKFWNMATTVEEQHTTEHRTTRLTSTRPHSGIL